MSTFSSVDGSGTRTPVQRALGWAMHHNAVLVYVFVTAAVLLFAVGTLTHAPDPTLTIIEIGMVLMMFTAMAISSSHNRRTCDRCARITITRARPAAGRARAALAVVDEFQFRHRVFTMFVLYSAWAAVVALRLQPSSSAHLAGIVVAAAWLAGELVLWQAREFGGNRPVRPVEGRQWDVVVRDADDHYGQPLFRSGSAVTFGAAYHQMRAFLGGGEFVQPVILERTWAGIDDDGDPFVDYDIRSGSDLLATAYIRRVQAPAD